MNKKAFLSSEYIDELSIELSDLTQKFELMLEEFLDKFLPNLDSSTITKLEKFNDFKLDFVFSLPPILAIFVSKKYNLAYLKAEFKKYLYSIDFNSKYLPPSLISCYNDFKFCKGIFEKQFSLK